MTYSLTRSEKKGEFTKKQLIESREQRPTVTILLTNLC
jgi:hypothetical protein